MVRNIVSASAECSSCRLPFFMLPCEPPTLFFMKEKASGTMPCHLCWLDRNTGETMSLWMMMRKDQPFVSCATYYPANAGTEQLGMTDSVDANGKGCHRDDMKKLCFKNNTCSELYNIDCSCDSSKVPPHAIGDYFTELFSNLAKGTYFGNFYSRTVCSYPGTEQGLNDMIAASNSLWKQRHGWCLFDDQLCHKSELKYRGHTECMASKNIMNAEMVDGILIQMPPRIFETQVALEQVYPSLYNFMLERLQDLHDWGYAELPIVFMEEIKGMSPEACERYWGGVDCQVGYRKEVYTQALNFSNGACIASPPGCNEVYYFPADKHTGTCIPILKNKTCLAEKDMLPAPQDSWQIVEGGVFPRILFLLVVVWLVVLLNKKKTHRSGWRLVSSLIGDQARHCQQPLASTKICARSCAGGYSSATGCGKQSARRAEE